MNQNKEIKCSSWKGKKDFVYISLFILLFVISMIALLLALSNPHCHSPIFSMKLFKELLGVMISAVAMVVTAYLVIMEVSASNRHREIEKEADKVYKQSVEVSSCQKEVQNLQQECLSGLNESRFFLGQIEEVKQNFRILLPTLFEDAIAVADESGNIRLREELKKKRARLLHNDCMLDEETRISLIRELSALGDITDIERLNSIYTSKSVSERLRFATAQALDALKKRVVI